MSIKGIDGGIELIVGVVLLIAPSLLHTVLEAVADSAGTHPGWLPQALANYLEGLDGRLAGSGTVIVTAFLIAHGAIKLALVYCLLRRWHRAYPVAMAVLTAFLLYEVYLLITAPTVTLGLFIVLDAAIIFLIYREYRQLARASNAEDDETVS